VPDGDWIDDQRTGLTLCDATSAAFAMDLPWAKLDVVTYSWQKALGGEAQHGVLILSPRAVARLESHAPPWPLPKLFRLTKGGRLIEGIFRGETINTPSMLAVEDALDGLRWAKSIGGLDALTSRTRENAAAVFAWVEATPWVDFLAADPATRSPTSICLAFAGADAERDREGQAGLAKAIGALLDVEGVAHDVVAHRDAPPGLRLWAGPTVERKDLEALLPWLDWARDQAVDSGERRG
jgi:phosphoserine aminotransferase